MTSQFPINIMAPVLIGIPVLALGIWLSLMWNHESRAAVGELAHEKIEQIQTAKDEIERKHQSFVAMKSKVNQRDSSLHTVHHTWTNCGHYRRCSLCTHRLDLGQQDMGYTLYDQRSPHSDEDKADTGLSPSNDQQCSSHSLFLLDLAACHQYI